MKRDFARISVDAVLSVADMARKDVNFDLIKVNKNIYYLILLFYINNYLKLLLDIRKNRRIFRRFQINQRYFIRKRYCPP